MLTGPGGAFALTSLELLLGTFLVMLGGVVVWPAISRGHWRATTWILFPLVAGVAFALPSALRTLALVGSVSMLIFLLAVYSQRPLLEWTGGAIAAGISVFVLLSAGLEACPVVCLIGPAHVIVGALFLGSITHGMALGHWYLNQPRLPIQPLLAGTHLMLGSIPPPLVIGFVTRSDLVAAIVPSGILPISAGSYWWAWVALLMMLVPLGLMIRSTVKSRSTQSATGLLYLSLVPALGAQFLLTLLFVS